MELQTVIRLGLFGLDTLLALALLAGGYAFLGLLIKGKERERTHEDTAYWIARSGVVVGHAISMMSVLAMPSDNWWLKAAWVAGTGLSAALLLTGLYFTKARIFGSKSTGAVVSFAVSVAVGLIIQAGLSGEADMTVPKSIGVTAAFVSAGLVFMAGLYIFNNVIFRLHRHVMAGNWAATVVTAGFVLSQGVVLNLAIAGKFNGWGNSFMLFAVTEIVCVALFYLCAWLVDLLVIRQAKMSDILANSMWSLALPIAAFMVALALVFKSAFPDI